ncbi:MAG: hypothetical protein Q4A28_03245 [Brachymonas sp.]|nr:hypothetical protein [Brachymonas sp.]
MSKYFTDLNQTMAPDLPYTEEGLLDFGALCSIQRFSKDARMDHMQQAIHGCHAIVSVLRTDDGTLCRIGGFVRGGLLDALAALLNGLAVDMDRLDEQRSKEAQP